MYSACHLPTAKIGALHMACEVILKYARNSYMQFIALMTTVKFALYCTKTEARNF